MPGEFDHDAYLKQFFEDWNSMDPWIEEPGVFVFEPEVYDRPLGI